jgi:late competence protein required for DNA uptake (superfamily II DNA/RNA helicase)
MLFHKHLIIILCLKLFFIADIKKKLKIKTRLFKYILKKNTCKKPILSFVNSNMTLETYSRWNKRKG